MSRLETRIPSPTTLIRSKLFVPPLRPNLVPRPQLHQRLDQALHLGHHLTLVSAPAGFGKTTLVAEWVRGLGADGAADQLGIDRVAWLSLDEHDNDPTSFLAYLAGALDHVDGLEPPLGKGAMAMLQSPQPPPAADVLTSLINELTAISGKVILVIDDYHVIDSSPVDDALTFLLEHRPVQLNLVIVTRIDPNLPLARHRARGQLTELRAADLRFTNSEAAEFLNQVMSLSLSARDIAALESRTEGWIAGLQLAAVSMKGVADVTRFIRSFTGSHHFVLDFLVEEVLEQQPESVQAFLLRTSILDRMTGSLCDALTGSDNSQSILETLEHDNLFIVRLDEERRWYRYHHLFSDLLRRRLRQTRPDSIPGLNHSASQWYERHGFCEEAIEHALRADDFERMAHLIELQVDALWARGEHRRLRRWLLELPDELVHARPHLCIFHTWYLFAGGELDAAEISLQAIDYALDAFTDPERTVLSGRQSAVKAFMNSQWGDVTGIIQNAHRALELLPEEDRVWRSLSAIALGNAYGFKGDMTAAYSARHEALKACQAAGEVYYVMLASMEVAVTKRSQGELQRTLEICEQQIQRASENGLSQTSLVGLLWLIKSEVLAEQNDLDEASRGARYGFQLAEPSADLAMLGWSYRCLIRVLFSAGDLTEAEATFQKLENLALRTTMPPWITDQMAAWQARLWLSQHRLEDASLWAEQRGLDSGEEPRPPREIGFFLLFDYLVLARILIAQGRLDEATALLQHLLRAAEASGRTSSVIEIKSLQALTFQAAGKGDRAVSTLKAALALARPEGFVRVFVDEGQSMARLLQAALDRGIVPEYVRSLLAAFPADESAPVGISSPRADQSGLVEPLSERELEVLQRIAEGLTNREIADRLCLSLNTVKVHTRNIYAKLGVHNRTQAVARARALDLLPSELTI